MEGRHRLVILKPGARVQVGLGQYQAGPPTEIIAYASLNPRRGGGLRTLDGAGLSQVTRVYRVRQAHSLSEIEAGWTLRDAGGRAWEITFVDPVCEPQPRWWDLHVKSVKETI